MQTECNADLFGFAPVEGRKVVAAFDGGTMTSDAGAMLLGATDRQIRVIERVAGCFTDHRVAELVVHEVAGLVGQRVLGIALGYEDLIDPTSCGTTRSWRCWAASLRRGARIVRRWPANRRSTGWS